MTKEKVKLEVKVIDGKEYYVDENNNKWETKKFSMKKAKQLSKTMINCTNCTNCKKCTDCEYCNDCINCNSCVDCTNCKKCISCDECENCISCTNCRKCRDCSKSGSLRWVNY